VTRASLDSAPFVNTTVGLTFAGNAYVNTTQRVTKHAFAISINKVFSAC
jgi:hypothetical protein